MQDATLQRAARIREFNRFYTNIIGLVNKTILDSPYSLAEARVLLELLMAGRYTATDLTRLLDIDPGYLSRILRRFRREKLLTTVRSPDDGRVQLLSLTDKGKSVMTAISDASTRQIVAVLNGLSVAEQQQLVAHMEAVRAILSRQPQPSGPVVIRTYRAGDAGYIAYRHGILYEQEYGLDKVFESYVIAGMAKFFAGGSDGEIWVAEAAGQVVGAIAIVAAGPGTGQLRWFLVEPAFRGSGLGRRLMNVAIDYCRQRAFAHVFLWTFRGLDAACHLYESFGFRLTEETENTTWRDKLTEQRWDLTLGE
ncbi:GNAT family N-acetyltransferase [Anaeroselena agilis]|uniref:Helix-turn-helix domain-containing GNAT family N-acetyltransferase n=1 Tax=Anaeroselena agilis TaxID=3063788 RepID=A0ABU3P0A8_9FIRM|nr:helix-turn-helix domain-containing GNAT family N-acetyltransferase [Selenomonadales bacterium 4137-cl]